jgi:hypothetical protein
MKYMLLTYLDEKAWFQMSEADQRAAMSSCGPHIERLMQEKKILGGAPLNATATATTLRVRDGKRLTTDGPFAETREQLGGYTIFEAKDLDEALSIAWGFFGGHPFDQKVSLEVRPIVELGPDGMPVKS